MENYNLEQEWIALSTPWIKESREGKNSNRTGLLDIYMLDECGEVKGLTILDSGCGEGRFCRILSQKGAKYVLGLDLCKPMIDSALELKGRNEDYKVANVENLDFINDETFDIAISYLNQCDLQNLHNNNKEVFRVLKKNGLFIVANLHPMRSAVGKWHKNINGEKEHVILDNYFDESERYWKMMGVDFTNFHRTLSTYLNSFLNAGFKLEKLIEPTIEKEVLKNFPELDDELRVPNFIIYKLKK